MYFFKHMEAGPRTLTVEPCRYHTAGCWRGDACKFSHLREETDNAISSEFERYPIGRTGVRPAYLAARRARMEGLTSPEIYDRFPDSFPPQDEPVMVVAEVTAPCPTSNNQIEGDDTHLCHIAASPEEAAAQDPEKEDMSCGQCNSSCIPRDSLPKPTKKFPHQPLRTMLERGRA